MRFIDIIHRWLGGMLGFLLAILGLSGSILVFKDPYLRFTLPHANDAYTADPLVIAGALNRLFDVNADRPASIVLAHPGLGVHRLIIGEGKGAYADQAGNIVASWSSVWERPEVWLLDLHVHLLAGKTGAIFVGILGLIGIAFIATGLVLWWRTRRTFSLRALPKRLSRPAILRHHRDLGVVVAPLMFLSMITGSILVLPPVRSFLLSPFSPTSDMLAATLPPKTKGGVLAIASLDWNELLADAQTRFPGAELRMVILPRAAGGLISIRLRQAAEWSPNGRTTVWFDPATGAAAGVRDATTLPKGLRILEKSYPLHAAKVGGFAFELATAIMGLGLTMLGAFAVCTFWSTKGFGKPVYGRRSGRSGGAVVITRSTENVPFPQSDRGGNDNAV